MKNPWFLFITVRVGLFFGILALMLLLKFDPFFSALIAATLGAAISLLFLGRQRDAVSRDVYERVNRKRKDDQADAENQALDEASDK
ncbi:MAG: DUF4229 domain-containing protein [Micrococcales bacterium]